MNHAARLLKLRALVVGLAGLSACAGLRSTSGTLRVSPSEATVRTQESFVFEIQGGVEPYSFEVINGSGLVAAERRAFRAPNTPSTSLVRIRDAQGRESVVVVKTEAGADHDCWPVNLAIVDSGIDLEHEELRPLLWRNSAEIPDNGRDDDGNGYIDDVIGWNFAGRSADPSDDNFHGTHVAGVAAGLANEPGRAPAVASLECHDSVRLMAIKLFDAYGVTTSSDIVASLRYAVDSGAHVINASFGARMNGSSLPASLSDTLAYVEAAGVPLVAAAGNYGQDMERFPIFPASAPNANILSVASLDYQRRLSRFSNYSAAHVDIAAPGESIQSTFPSWITPGMRESGRRRVYRDAMSGTSAAAPAVAGALSRLWSQTPALSHTQARERLLQRAERASRLERAVEAGRMLNLDERAAAGNGD